MNKDKENIIWQKLCIKFRSIYGESVYNNWLKPLEFKSIEGNTLYLNSPSRFIRNWVKNNYKSQLDTYLNNIEKSIYCIEILTENTEKTHEKSKEKTSSKSEVIEVQRQNSLFENDNPEFSSNINKKLTFESFEVSNCNNLAHQIVSETAKNNFNPLVISGGVGRGKTHLLNALANKEISGDNFKNVILLSSEKFMFLYVKSLRQNKIIEFKEYIRSADLLLIDDIKFFAGKNNVSEEFMHCFDNIISSGGKIVVTCDKNPVNYEKLDERLRNRLSSGICVEISPPDSDLKYQIISKKLESHNLSKEILAYIAENIHGSVRDLEGAINRLNARAYILNNKIDKEFLKSFFKENSHFMPRKILNIENIKQSVCEKFEVKSEDLDSAKKSRNISRPRQVAMYLCKKLTMKSYVDIAQNFGGKDHSTVINAVRSVEKLAKKDSDLNNIISELESSLS